MTVVELLFELESRGVMLFVDGNNLEFDAPHGTLTDADIDVLRTAKPEILRLHRLSNDEPIDDDAANLLSCVVVEPDDVPMCDRCGRFCDVQTLSGTWDCSNCDPMAAARQQKTLQLLERAESIRRGRL